MSVYRTIGPLVTLSDRMSHDRGIKHDFPFINIHKVPREVLKTEGVAEVFNLPEEPSEC